MADTRKASIIHTVVPILVRALLVTTAGGAAAMPAADGHYTEHTCSFGTYGPVTVHEGGIGRTYITVGGKDYPATGGENFVQSDADDSVAVTFDGKGGLFYRGEIPGRDCRVTRR